MRLAWTLLALVSLAARPAEADKRLDQAVAKSEAQLAKGKEDEAVKILQKAVSQAPRDPEPPLALWRLLTRLGRRDQAAAALATAGERAGNAPPAVRARAPPRRDPRLSSSAAEKGPSASLAPSAARSTYREYASRAPLGRRLASGPF